ncbi:MAG: TIGR03087 family PEP-CTERM/XrtA system glycosyltransferase [Novosphingobium sp.]
MTGEILFLAHRIPFPPDRGDKIRSHHLLQRLAQLAPVHVATFADDEDDAEAETELAALARSYHVVRRPNSLLLAGIQGLLRDEAVSLPAFHSDKLVGYVAKVLAEHPIETIFVFSGQMGQYVPDDFAGRVIVDFCDVDSAKFEAYAAAHRWPESWIHAREGRLLRREERRLALRADRCLLISAEEAALFAERLPPLERGAVSIGVLGNGIDSDRFAPGVVAAEPRLAALPRGRVVFTGQMDYPPNVAAVQRFARGILPLVRRQVPAATFHVIGREPTEAVLALGEADGCSIWGRVEDMRPWLAGADIAAVPLAIARGVQNKVLEAMAMGLPVVLTSGAATGIAASDGEHFCVADGDAAIAAQIVALLGDPVRAAEIGRAARDYVVQQQSWPAALGPLDALLGVRTVRHAA